MRSTKAIAAIGAAVAIGALSLVGVAGATASPKSSSAHATKQNGGVVRWAEPPGATPNYIFPFDSSAVSSVNNISQLQYLLYRPLYMFGAAQSTSPGLDIGLSLAAAPAFSKGDTVATINMKSYKWSNGEAVNATDVAFFMNMLHAEKANFFSYVPGLFPDNVANVAVASPSKLTFTFTHAFNPGWMTSNEFAQITPMPKAWDIAAAGGAAGSGGCSSGTYATKATDAACVKVWTYLTGQAKNIAGYSANPLWSVVDGPFTIAAAKGGSFLTSGAVTMVPNPAYSGPQKPSISKFEELPFTTDSAQYNALLGGNLDVGYLPTQDITKPTSNALKAGPNNPRLANNFYITPWVLFGYNYAVLKLHSTGDGGAAGKIFSQLYFRQALQSMIDQSKVISNVLKGYGVPTYGPVPVLPKNSYVDSYEQQNPYPYNPAKAKSYLTSHGWNVVPGGTDTCVKPGTGPSECGAGIPKGAKLNFSFAYPTGTLWQLQLVQIEQSAWSSIGIHMTLAPATFDTVIGDYVPPCSSTSACTAEFGWWGGGWEYSPDFYPSGELLFATGAGSNSANYSSPKADALIKATTDTTANLDQYQNYIAQQLPAIWQPNADYEILEVNKSLQGFAPQSSVSTLFPEYWYFVKKS
jgi:peptide/nickel transport system substrate-binding protein